MGSSVYNKYGINETFGGKAVLNLGCGFSKFRAKNVVNLDAEDCAGADVTWDLSKTPLPFKDESFDIILANHILEHVPNWWNCFEDCARILKTGGRMEVWVPGAGSDSVLGFRDHLNTINYCSWWGTWGLHRAPNNAWAQANAEGVTTRMRMIDHKTCLENKWWIRILPKSGKNWVAHHLRNVVYESGFIFTKQPAAQEVAYLSSPMVEALI